MIFFFESLTVNFCYKNKSEGDWVIKQTLSIFLFIYAIRFRYLSNYYVITGYCYQEESRFDYWGFFLPFLWQGEGGSKWLKS